MASSKCLLVIDVQRGMFELTRTLFRADAVLANIVAYVWYAPENHELNVVYYNGVDFIDMNGSHHHTIGQISAELDSMALGVTVHK